MMKAIHWTQLVIRFFLSDVLILDVHGSSDVVVDLQKLYIPKICEALSFFDGAVPEKCSKFVEVSYVSSSV